MFYSKINPKTSSRKKSLAAGPPSWPLARLAGTSIAFDANRILFDHACDTMPDSLSRRRLVLLALKIKTHPRQPAYLQICAQLAALESIAELHAQLQAEIQNALQSSAGSRREIAP